ncbi:alpha/beta fold hydrolase [Micromonospora echinofusca]|uniref:alpha/beta fold hydrolase n=1 Tax=Micromonospora echinofusca TaxID=47858 RepID=UPI0027DDDA44|nr:alpha/beta hydrolase [Micromonospora echinofusca]
MLLLHGFPECWYSWRHQLTALAAAGFHAVALDQRGVARSERPTQVEAYSILHLVGDVTGVLDALGEERAALVGHDWGAYVAWHVAKMRPDRVRGIVGLSVPHQPRGIEPPMTTFRKHFGDGFYMSYFLQPGPADEELARDRHRTFRLLLRGGSPGKPRAAHRSAQVMAQDGTLLGSYPEPSALPNWLTSHDIDVFAAEFADGFTGGLNWYRNLDRNWELTSAWHNAPVQPSALYIVGDQDRILLWPDAEEHITTMREHVPNLRDVIRIPDVGHWTQQEAPHVVNTALVDFLRSL